MAHALARNDFPVPGGPYNNIPDQDFLYSSKKCGNLVGKITASCKEDLASSNPATSDHLIFGFSVTIAPDNASFNF